MKAKNNNNNCSSDTMLQDIIIFKKSDEILNLVYIRNSKLLVICVDKTIRNVQNPEILGEMPIHLKYVIFFNIKNMIKI